MWRCNESSSCKARLHTHGYDLEQIPIERNVEHNHAAKPARIEVRQRINSMKQIAEVQPDKRTRAIVIEAKANMTVAAAALMPTYNAIRQRVLCQRVDKNS